MFPEGMVPLGNEPFSFECHPGVTCFTACCKKVDMILYPYDIIRLKQRLGIRSDEFMHRHTRLVKGDNPFFPTVMLALTDDDPPTCPFLAEDGCAVYPDRPSACRTYPLERAVDRSPGKKGPKEFYFLTNHDYCLGHKEQRQFTVREWIRNQRLPDYNTYNELWAEVDTLFASNPWQGEGAGGPRQQMAFMVSYNIDGFRDFCVEQRLFTQFKLGKDQKRRIQQDDAELLKFGFEWLKLNFTGRSSLVK